MIAFSTKRLGTSYCELPFSAAMLFGKRKELVDEKVVWFWP